MSAVDRLLTGVYKVEPAQADDLLRDSQGQDAVVALREALADAARVAELEGGAPWEHPAAEPEHGRGCGGQERNG